MMMGLVSDSQHLSVQRCHGGDDLLSSPLLSGAYYHPVPGVPEWLPWDPKLMDSPKEPVPVSKHSSGVSYPRAVVQSSLCCQCWCDLSPLGPETKVSCAFLELSRAVDKQTVAVTSPACLSFQRESEPSQNLTQ